MSAPLPAGNSSPRDRSRPGRIVGLVVVWIIFLAVAAAVFVISYSGVHNFVLDSGVTARLARYYPVLLDAMLVIAGAAVVWLRDAGVPSKLFAWLALIIVLGAAAAADALHAAGIFPPGSEAPVIAAVVPWVLIFIGFALLLVMLRHARVRLAGGRRAGSGDGTGSGADERLLVRQPGMSGHVPARQPRQPSAAPSIVPGLDRLTVGRVPGQPEVTVPRQPGPYSGEDAAEAGATDTVTRPTIVTMASVWSRAGRATAADAGTDTGTIAETAISDVEPSADAAAGTDIDADTGTGTGADTADPSLDTGADDEPALADLGPGQDADEPDLDFDPDLDDPSSNDAAFDRAGETTPESSADPGEEDSEDTEPHSFSPAPAVTDEHAGDGDTETGDGDSGDSSTGAGEPGDAEQADADMPTFHRMWSAPTPPPEQ